MQNNITFENYKGNLSSHKTELLVCGLFEGENVSPEIDKLFDNNLSKAIKIESFKGKYKKKITIYGDTLKRTVIIGLGKKNEISNLRFREIGAMISNYANQLSIKHISIDSKSLCLNDNQSSKSLFEGIILGNYEFLVYKTVDTKSHSLNKVTVLGECDKKKSNVCNNCC